MRTPRRCLGQRGSWAGSDGGLLQHLPSFADSIFDTVELPHTTVPYRISWAERVPDQPLPPKTAPPCPTVENMLNMLSPSAWGKMRSWFQHQLRDLVSIKQQLEAGILPDDVKRDRPPAAAIGQSEMMPWARGIVWDCRQQCCRPLNFSAPISSDLNLRLLKSELGCYPDQALLAYLLKGVRLPDTRIVPVWLRRCMRRASTTAS